MIAKHKIYLSKSKAGDAAYTEKVKNALKALNFKVLEFTGGTYTTKELSKADILMVVPPGLNSSVGWRVGKGQYAEIEYFESMAPDKNIFIVSSIDDKTLTLMEYFRSDVLDLNWQTDYATIMGFGTFEQWIYKTLLTTSEPNILLNLDYPENIPTKRKIRLACITLLK